MSLFFPAGLLGLLAVPVLVALSLWRWRRREATVSSLLLWREVAAERRAAPRAYRRRRVDPLVVVRVAVALVLTGALCGLAWVRVEPQARRLVLVLDRSASMGMGRSGGHTRWGSCREELTRLLRRCRPSDRVTLVAVPTPADGEVPPELSPAAAIDTLGLLAPSDAAVEPRRLADAAVEAARAYPHAFVVVATDDLLPGLPDAVALLARGGSAAGRGIVAFAARERPDGRYEILVEVANAAGGPGSAEVVLLADGRALGVQSMVVLPRGRMRAIFEADLDAVAVLEARLRGSDALAPDDHAWLVRRTRPTRVASVGQESPALRRALAVQRGVQVVEVTRPDDVPADCDAVVWYRTTPSALRQGYHVVVAPTVAVGALRLGEEVEVGEGAVVAPRDPLMTAVNLDGVTVGRTSRVAVPPGFETLARAGDVPLIGRWREGEASVVYVGVDPAVSNWALSPSFPIFWANVVANVAGDAGRPGGFHCARPGEALQASWEAERSTLRGPGDETRELVGTTFRPERVGLYRLTAGDRSETFAVSLLSEAETMAAGARSELPLRLFHDVAQPVRGVMLRRLSAWLAILGLLLVLLHGRLAGGSGRF